MGFSQQVLDWFSSYGRKHLPWQGQSAYCVWLSEIMLQQTQVATVIPYYNRFMHHFPSVTQLANAHIDEILNLWAGLGYYSRARNAHQCAKIIVENYAGEFPRRLDALCQLPGIGPSTAGAILALAFNQRATILDGNVKRVLCRYAGIMGYPGEHKIQKKLWHLAEKLTPQANVADYTQAMMDLGAMVCTPKNPTCSSCPLQSNCFALQHQQVTDLPTKKTRKPLPQKHKYFLVLMNEKSQVLLMKRPSIGIWGGLWSFPEYDEKTQIIDDCLRRLGLSVQLKRELAHFKHSFTHFRLMITPITALVNKVLYSEVMDKDQYFWYNLDQPLTIGVAKPVKTLLKNISN